MSTSSKASKPAVRRGTPPVEPTGAVEQELLTRPWVHPHTGEVGPIPALVLGVDEVGRGSIAGPVAVGVAGVRVSSATPPAGIRDSKALTKLRREALVEPIRSWAACHAVGFASAGEIDEHGITAALGLAGRRALLALHNAGQPIQDAVVLLDGSADWLSPALPAPTRVRTRVKADRDCISVAAASILAKVARDTLMAELGVDCPEYGWRTNAGYGSAAHYAAIRAHGVTPFHRRTWLGALGSVERQQTP